MDYLIDFVCYLLGLVFDSLIELVILTDCSWLFDLCDFFFEVESSVIE